MFIWYNIKLKLYYFSYTKKNWYNTRDVLSFYYLKQKKEEVWETFLKKRYFVAY